MENKILELEKKLQDMELKYNHLLEIVEELNYYFLEEISYVNSQGNNYNNHFSIPRDNSRYLELGLSSSINKERYRHPWSSPSGIVRDIIKEGVGCVAPKYLWSIYDKVDKLKKQEENDLIRECVDGFIKNIKYNKNIKYKF